ncbi:uncharacterized protein LOC111371405 [Olea europaea var. sylvestris]|uniref:uncharacterized protein LOC111371405 n=1 Tax=Olea europaea var. sylvestris TaxID=158386 RepID=UPI000C1D47AF|nr:uncharacterized protein LOC111371405 [Olea europaea var. sylvestris]XP_022849143.1 uncharacterized protein LOC111371405 [Olea europaea var. sylvestris]XP_022849144.1 uncharacterized protein LOC111371405 [Olea europaea var. sylvestris]XP_022849145.1 uncharacterized protein LOC111371405 [Olea europaea var. sylvestris]
MNTIVAALWTALLFAAYQFPLRLAFPSTVPAMLWSPHLDPSSGRMKEVVDYRVLSPGDLANSVMTEGGWSDFLCMRKEAQPALDLALIFVGEQLQSLDISGSKNSDPALVDLLKVSFSNASFSVAFPYVSPPEEKVAMESSLISEFADACQHNLQLSNIAFLDSCSVEGRNFDKIADVHSVHDYLRSTMDKKSERGTNLIVFCHGGSRSMLDSDQPYSEGQILSELLNSVEQMGAKYTALYVSDPFKSIMYPSHRELERFLAESTFGNGSSNSTVCDGVCQIKSSLLEGILVVS